MRRADLLPLIPMTSNRFNLLQGRSQLPFKDSGQTGWGRYSIADAFRLMLLLELAGAGKSYDEARATVNGQFDDLWAMAGEGHDGDLWFGTVRSTILVEGEAGSHIEMPLVASAMNINAAVEDVRLCAGITSQVVTAICVINASFVARVLASRATRLGLKSADLPAFCDRFGVS